MDGKYVVSLDPKLGLHCLDAKTGKQLWSKNLVTEYKATIPPWYNGQNPLLEEDRIVIATGEQRCASHPAERRAQRVDLATAEFLARNKIHIAAERAERHGRARAQDCNRVERHGWRRVLGRQANDRTQ